MSLPLGRWLFPYSQSAKQRRRALRKVGGFSELRGSTEPESLAKAWEPHGSSGGSATGV